jgi:hypothetical protein
VHSTEHLTTDAFALLIAGERASIRDLFPGFSADDRLGVVVRSPGGGAGAANLVLAAVTAFYDIHRAVAGGWDVPPEMRPFYPDYFAFHLGERRGDHAALDIWPPHKEVVVPADPEQALQAINDRAITRLAVEEVGAADAELEPETVASAVRRVRTVVAFSASGRSDCADVSLAGNQVTESFARCVTESAVAGDAAALRSSSGPRTETYRRVELADALRMLAAAC